MRRAAVAAVVAAAVAVAPAAGAAPVKPTVGTFAGPVFVTAAPLDTERVMVVEQAGLVQLLRGGARQPAPFLDLRDRVNVDGDERGLLSIASHPTTPPRASFTPTTRRRTRTAPSWSTS